MKEQKVITNQKNDDIIQNRLSELKLKVKEEVENEEKFLRDLNDTFKNEIKKLKQFLEEEKNVYSFFFKYVISVEL
jgi:hypothetical protein